MATLGTLKPQKPVILCAELPKPDIQHLRVCLSKYRNDYRVQRTWWNRVCQNILYFLMRLRVFHLMGAAKYQKTELIPFRNYSYCCDEIRRADSFRSSLFALKFWLA